jgi:serine/threonine protein kinase
MAEFNPSPHDSVVIGGQTYRVMPHPAVPTFAFGQEGRKAFVYQVAQGGNGARYALKKFKEAYRVSALVDVCDALARFAAWPGLEVCARECLHYPTHRDALDDYPDLEYAVLMPWIVGSTWYDIIIGMRPLSRLQAIGIANATAQVLTALEESGLAHGDIAAANVIVNWNDTARAGTAHLIDVEDLYAPGFSPPGALPAGTDGYAHQTASEGLWGPYSDRFAGAVILAEMAAWHVAEIRKKAEEEHYFAANEMQVDSPRYRLMHQVLADTHPALGDLLAQAWESETLEDCPRMQDWYDAIYDVYHQEKLAEVVSVWQPIALPKEGLPDAAPRSSPILSPTPAPEPEPAQSEQATQPAAAEQAAPAPSPAISPPPVPPPAPPSIGTASVPAQISPPPAEGPVIEWRPIVPAGGLGALSGNGLASRPLTPLPVEPAEPVEAPVVDDEREPEEAVEEAPAEVDLPPDDDREEALPDFFEEPPWMEEALADDLNRPTSRGLLTPILDLSYVDERSRPMLVWTESRGATHYILQESRDPDFKPHREVRIKGEETSWRPRRRRTGELFYRVRAGRDDEAGPWSSVLHVRMGD